MRIAFVGQPFGALAVPPRDPVQRWTWEVARRLAERHDVIFYGRRGTDHRLAEEEIRSRVTVRRFGTLDDGERPARLLQMVSRCIRLPRRRPLFAQPYYCLSYWSQVALDARRRRVDVLHVHDFTQAVPMLRRLNPGARIVLHMRREWLSHLDPAFVAPRLARADMVLTASDSLTRRALQAYPFLEGRCGTLPEGACPPDVAGGSGDAILFLGPISPEKGVHVLIDAFQRIADDFPGTTLELVGRTQATPRELLVDVTDDAQVAALESWYEGRTPYASRLARSLPSALEPRVVFRGVVPPDGLRPYLERAAVLVNPALCESFGTRMVDGVAAGLPVVASNVGGMAELVEDGRTGLLVPRNDPAALADALARLLRDPRLRRAMGDAGRARAMAVHSWDFITDLLLRQYAWPDR